MKEFLKPFLIPSLLIVYFIIGLFMGFRVGLKENEYKNNSHLIDSLKSVINDNQKLAKLDTIFLDGTHTIDTIKIYYKIKKNEAKNDTSVIGIYDRFQDLLSKNRYKANQRGK